jgi:hypothetical protein
MTTMIQQEQQDNIQFVESFSVKYTDDELSTNNIKSYIFARDTIKNSPIEFLNYFFRDNENTLKILLDLFPDPNNCDILINILFNLSSCNIDPKDITKLLKNHHHFFNNDNITQEEIIKEIKKNIYVLLLIPDNKISDTIIYEAIKQSMDTLLLLPYHILKYCHYEQAINMDFELTGNHKDSLPKIISDISDKLYDHLADKLIIHVLTQNGESLDLLYVNTIKESYCIQAVIQNGNALKYVPNNLKTPLILELAIETNPQLKKEDLLEYYKNNPERTYD